MCGDKPAAELFDPHPETDHFIGCTRHSDASPPRNRQPVETNFPVSSALQHLKQTW